AQGLPGPPGRRGRDRAARAAGGGDDPGPWRGGDTQPRRGPGDPGAAAGVGRGGLPALRERVPLVRLARRLRARDRGAAGGARRREGGRRDGTSGVARAVVARGGTVGRPLSTAVRRKDTGERGGWSRGHSRDM